MKRGNERRRLFRWIKITILGFISDCNILARDSMGFVHALLLVNITSLPYRPDIDTDRQLGADIVPSHGWA